MTDTEPAPDQIGMWIKTEVQWETFQAEAWQHTEERYQLIAEEENHVINRTAPQWRVTFLPKGYNVENDKRTETIHSGLRNEMEAVSKLRTMLRNRVPIEQIRE